MRKQLVENILKQMKSTENYFLAFIFFLEICFSCFLMSSCQLFFTFSVFEWQKIAKENDIEVNVLEKK